MGKGRGKRNLKRAKKLKMLRERPNWEQATTPAKTKPCDTKTIHPAHRYRRRVGTRFVDYQCPGK